MKQKKEKEIQIKLITAGRIIGKLQLLAKHIFTYFCAAL